MNNSDSSTRRKHVAHKFTTDSLPMNSTYSTYKPKW